MLSAKLKIILGLLLVVGALGLGACAVATAPPSDPPAPKDSTTAAEPRGKKAVAPPAQDRAAQEARPGVPVRGRVLDNQGQPLAGVRLFVPRLATPNPTSARDFVIDPVGTTDAKGGFHLTIARTGGELRHYLVAYADGFGVDWIDLAELKPAAEVTLRLPPDQPITGRVVNTENKPLAGVTVSASALYVPADEKLDDYLAGWLKRLRDTLSTPRKRLYAPLDGITGVATTDKDGRFTLRGAGIERIVHVTFSGAGVAHSTPYVITRRGFDPKPYNDELLKKEHDDLRVLNRFLGLYGPDLTFVAEAGRTIEGVVKDQATGKPVPGAMLFAHTGFGEGLSVTSDKEGKYRLDGIPKNARGYDVSAAPPRGTAYLLRNVHAADSPGFMTVKLDVELARGAVVSGRVVDRQTGRGVETGVRFAPLPDNKFFGSKPGFDNYRHDRTMTSTDKEGRFRLVTIPGRALVMAQVHAGENFSGQHMSPYRMAVPDPDHKDLFQHDKDDDTWHLTTANGLEFLSTENAVKVIDIAETGETTVELFVDRGSTGRVVVQDAAGKPLTGAWVSGLTQHWPITFKLPEASAPVLALDPQKPRELAVYHAEKQLGGTATIRGDEKEPVIVKLGPLGKVTGRFKDAEGNPLAGATVSVNARGTSASELYRFAHPGQPVITDKDGCFTLTGVVPGVSFFLQIRQGENFFGGKPKIGLRKLAPGENLDLGDRTLEVLR